MSARDKLEDLKVTIEKVLFQDYNLDDEIYFSYMKARDDEGNGIILKGHTTESPHSLTGLAIKVFGDFVYDDYKKTYVFEFTSYNVDTLEFSIFLKMLGFKKQTIEKIIENFKYEEFVELLKNEEIEELTLIKGIGKKTALKAVKKFKTYREMKILTENLSPFGFNIYDIHKIHNYFKEEGTEDFDDLCFKIVLNPYILLNVPGMDFHKIDEIALNQIGQIKSDSLVRIKEGIKYALELLKNSKGDTIIDVNPLFRQSYKVLETDKFSLNEELFHQGLEKAIKEGDIIEIEKGKYILKKDSEEENLIYSKMIKALNLSGEYDFLLTEEEAVIEIESFESDEGIKYSKEQKESLVKILTSPNPVFFINGYAGTGKTTVTKAAVRILIRTGKLSPADVMVCALAGTAANRAKNVIGLPYSKTIHSMIGITENPKTGVPMFKFNENLKLPYKLIIVDESAMIDNFLFRAILEAVDFEKTKIIFIGDIAQLPPVGAGNPFESFVGSGITEKIKVNFTKIFRQKDGVLIQTANNIRQGIIDDFLNDEKVDFKDFYYAQFGGDEKIKIKEKMESSVKEDLKRYFFNIAEGNYEGAIGGFQTLAPKKEGFLGVYHLNRIMQRELHKTINSSMDERFVLSYYIIDFLSAKEEKKYFYALKIKSVMEKIKSRGYRTQTESKIFEEILKKINSAVKRNVFYHLEKYLRTQAPFLFNYYGYYFGDRYIYKEKDKIIHLKNGDYITFYLESYQEVKNYIKKEGILKEKLKKDEFLKNKIKKQKVYNGQVGIIDMIIPNLGIFVIYPFEGYVVLYNELKYDVVNLAYSISVHKSQGQEYKRVYIPILDKHLFMLNSRALYTAVTRAKEKVFIYAQKYCFPKAVSKKDTEKRDTLLYRILKGV